MRGAGHVFVLDKMLAPDALRVFDPISLHSREKKPNEYKPVQVESGSSDEIRSGHPHIFCFLFSSRPDDDLFVQPLRRRQINRGAAREQVINDLYRIMKIAGFPRVDVTILEEVVTKAAPSGREGRRDTFAFLWLNDRMNEVRNTFTNLRTDQALVHFEFS